MDYSTCSICKKGSCNFETRCCHFYHEVCLKLRANNNLKEYKCARCDTVVTSSRRTETFLKRVLEYDYEDLKVELQQICPLFELIISNENLPFEIIIENCIKAGWKLDDTITHYEGRLIHLLAKSKRLDLLEFIISKGADIESRDSLKETALNTAVCNNNLEMVKALVAHGANVNTNNCQDMTPIKFAARESNYEMVKFLLENGADVNGCGAEDNNTPMLLLIDVGSDFRVYDLLAEYGAKETVDTCFHAALKHYNIEWIEYLLKKVQI